MATASAGVYQLIFTQVLQSVTLINSFWYLNTLSEDDHQELLVDAFEEDVLPSYPAVQSASVSYISLTGKNPTGDLADFVREPIITSGSLGGDALPVFNALGFTLQRTNKTTRNGQKRVAGGTEADNLNGAWIGGYLTSADILGGAMSTQIATVGAIFDPIIARDDLVTPQRYTVNDIQGFLTNPRVTSQVSRKG